MNSDIKKLFTSMLETIALCIIIGLGWQLAEVVMYGKTNPNFIDSIVTVILASFIKYYIDSKCKEEN